MTKGEFLVLNRSVNWELTGRSTVDVFLELLTNGQMTVNASENNCSVITITIGYLTDC